MLRSLSTNSFLNPIRENSRDPCRSPPQTVRLPASSFNSVDDRANSPTCPSCRSDSAGTIHRTLQRSFGFVFWPGWEKKRKSPDEAFSAGRGDKKKRGGWAAPPPTNRKNQYT